MSATVSVAAADGARTPASGGRGLLLVEPLAAGPGGHWSKALVLLAEAASAAGRPCVVIAARGIDRGLREELERAEARVLEGVPQLGARALLAAGNLLHHAFEVLQPRFPGRPLAYQLRHLARCLVEAASLRAARRAPGAEHGFNAVVLTANDTLPGLTAALSRVAHVRFVHEVCEYECRTIRWLERVLRGRLRHVHALCPTASVAGALRARYPTLEVRVQTFAMADPRDYVVADDRSCARARLEIAQEAIVGSLVGGWWQVKDHDAVLEALRLAGLRFTLLVAGHRLDPDLLRRIAAAHSGAVHVIDRALSSDELRAVFAASDFTIVSRRPNGKESGVALDAIAHGVPLVISDQDGGLSERLRGRAWARVFRSGDPGALAEALAAAAGGQFERPPRESALELGMLRAEQMLEALDG